MVFKINNQIKYSNDKRQAPTIKLPRIGLRADPLLAIVIIEIIRTFLFIYDVISWPIYFLIQRPDKCALEAKRVRSKRVDNNTWIRTSRYPNGIRLSKIQATKESYQVDNKFKHMGKTICEIFANSVKEYSTQSCLGYRAVVTCPVMSMDELGNHVLREKSFRSDYTWYTYGQIGCRVQDIASGLCSYSVYPSSRALFLASSNLEWFCAAQACFQLGVQIVLPPESNDSTTLLKEIIEEAQVKTIFISLNKLNRICSLLTRIKREIADHTGTESDDTDSKVRYVIKLIVIIDWQFSVDLNDTPFAKLHEASSGLVGDIVSIGQLEEQGAESPIELCCSKALDDTSTRLSSTDELISFASTPIERSRNTSDVGLHQNLINPLRQATNSHTSLPSSTVPLRRSTTAIPNTLSANGSSYGVSSAGSSLNNNSHLTRSCRVTRSNSILSLEGSQPKPQDSAVIKYTFGSMGQLKPIMLTHSYLSRCNHYLFLDGMVGGKDVHCATLTSENVIEFMTEMCLFSHGGRIGYSDSLRTLFYDGVDLFERDKSDLEALRPSFLLLRPYMLESLRTSILNYLQCELNPLLSFIMINVLFDYKKQWAKRYYATPIIDRLFCAKLKDLFGGNIKYIICNGATDCSETKDFFTFMVDTPVIELYGPDEAIVSLISVNDIWDYKRRVKSESNHQRHHHRNGDDCQSVIPSAEQAPSLDDGAICNNSGVQLKLPDATSSEIIFSDDRSKNLVSTSSILCPTLGTRIRLEDWEDFRTTDKPYPRGRLIIGGEGVCQGYFCRPSTTEKLFYKDSDSVYWFRTNDIARAFPNGSFEIISAMSDMFKLADGQFISLSQIEHVLRNSQFVENCCSILSDDRRLVVNLVVPNLRRLALKSPGEANLKVAFGLESEPEELIDVDFRREVCNDRLLCEFVSDHLIGLIEEAGLKTVKHRFLLVPEFWTPESELVTSAYEPKRSAIQKYYATDIQSIFQMEALLAAGSNRLSLRRGLLANNRSKKSSGAHTSDGGLSLRTI